MSSKGLNNVSKDCPETSDPANIVDQIEAKHFHRLAGKNGDTVTMIQNEVDRCRVQARGGIRAFLEGSSFGQLLVQYVVSDPLQKEREMRADQIEHYAQMLASSGILPTPELAQQYARSCFDTLPNAHPIIIFQAQLQGLLENAFIPFFSTGNLADLLQSYQRLQKELPERFNFSEATISEKDALQLLFREFVWKIKIQIAHLLSGQKYAQVLEILAALNTLSNNEKMDLWAYLPVEVNLLSRELSENPQQRKILTDFSFRRMTVNGLNSFEEFSAFLQQIGVKKLQGEELTALLDYQYLERNLDFAWKRDKKNYFQVIEFLLEIEILTPSYLISDKMLHRSIEYYLVSFYNGEVNSLKRDVLPYLLKLGIFPKNPADPRENDQLLDQYEQLCLRLKLEKDFIIEQNYTRLKKPNTPQTPNQD